MDPPKPDQESTKRLPKKLQEAQTRLLGDALGALGVHKAPQATILDTFIVFRDSKRPPGGPQVTIYGPCQRFRASRRDHDVSASGVDPRLGQGWAGVWEVRAGAPESLMYQRSLDS